MSSKNHSTAQSNHDPAMTSWKQKIKLAEKLCHDFNTTSADTLYDIAQNLVALDGDREYWEAMSLTDDFRRWESLDSYVPKIVMLRFIELREMLAFAPGREQWLGYRSLMELHEAALEAARKVSRREAQAVPRSRPTNRQVQEAEKRIAELATRIGETKAEKAVVEDQLAKEQAERQATETRLHEAKRAESVLAERLSVTEQAKMTIEEEVKVLRRQNRELKAELAKARRRIDELKTEMDSLRLGIGEPALA